MQAVVDEQHGVRRVGAAAIAGELALVLQRGRVAALELGRELAGDDAVRRHVGMAAGGKRRGGVEKRFRFGDHPVAARLVIALGLAGLVRDDVGAVERVIEAAPARIGGVERVARVGQRHHELRAANLADLLVDVRRLDRLCRRLGQQIADVLQERGVGVHVERLAFLFAVPAIDLGLQRIARLQEIAQLRREIAHDPCEPRPERIRRHAGAGRGLLGDEIGEDRRHLQAVSVDTRHDCFSLDIARRRMDGAASLSGQRIAIRRTVTGF